MKTPDIFHQFALAFVPARYDMLTRVKTGSMIVFVTLLALISTVISAISQTVTFAPVDVGELVEQMPDFTMTDGHLSLQEDFLYEKDGVYVYMTDDVEGFSYGDAAEKAADGYQDIILVGRDRVFIMQNRGKLRYQFVGFETFGRNKQLSKERTVDAIMPVLRGLLILMYLCTFVGRVLVYFLFSAVYMLIGMLIASGMKKRIEAGALFRTAVYAKVLMFVAAMVLELIPFLFLTVPFLLRVPVTIGFMAFAIAKLQGNDQAPAPMPVTMGPGGQGWQ